MTVAELLARMSSREFSDWLTFASLEPIGERRADYRAALVAQAIVAVNTPKGKRRPKTEELLLRFGLDEEAGAPETLRDKLAVRFGVELPESDDADDGESADAEWI